MDPINQWQGLLSSPFQRQPREMAFKAAKGKLFNHYSIITLMMDLIMLINSLLISLKCNLRLDKLA